MTARYFFLFLFLIFSHHLLAGSGRYDRDAVWASIPGAAHAESLINLKLNLHSLSGYSGNDVDVAMEEAQIVVQNASTLLAKSIKQTAEELALTDIYCCPRGFLPKSPSSIDITQRLIVRIRQCFANASM